MLIVHRRTCMGALTNCDIAPLLCTQFAAAVMCCSSLRFSMRSMRGLAAADGPPAYMLHWSLCVLVHIYMFILVGCYARKKAAVHCGHKEPPSQAQGPSP